MGEPFRPVDPTNLRPMLFLEAAREIMLDGDWPFRAVTVVMEDHGGPGRHRRLHQPEGRGHDRGPATRHCRPTCRPWTTAAGPFTVDPARPPSWSRSSASPLERMVKESPVTPLDVPLHPQAAAVWRELGYL
jgi:hypothetical protein